MNATRPAAPPVIFLLGPTASGKTDLSVAVAQALNAEIVSVDSSLVYRGMDIGTAKPTKAERRGVPHHLIDVCDPADAYSVARFRADASRCILDIESRGGRVVLAGGTMLYFNALEHGLAPLPEADPQVRAELSDEAERLGWAHLHRQLADVDPVAAARIHPNDPQRLQRALEVYRITGRSLSELQAESVGGLPRPPIKFALLPASRSWLHQRIERRFDQMLEQGLLDEVRVLRAREDLTLDTPAMRSVGYRQAWMHLAGDVDQSTFVQSAKTATRQLAKRQITWCRGMSDLQEIACDLLSPAEQLERMLTACGSDVQF